MMRKLRHLGELLLTIALLSLLRLLPLDWSSAFGGWLGRTLGPRLGVTRVARRNLMRALPERAEEHEAILLGMWDNLGRTVMEYAFIRPLFGCDPLTKRITIHGKEHIDRALSEGKSILFISGHFANWEVMSKSAAMLDQPMMLIYRPPNNPFLDRLLYWCRIPFYSGLVTKSVHGTRMIVKTLKQGKAAGMLVDQKMNNGVASTFFGHRAMTAPTVAQLGLKPHVAVIPGAIYRQNGAHFVLTLEPPMTFATTGDAEADVQAGLLQVNQWLERVIRKHPDQWFWVHKRWPKDGE